MRDFQLANATNILIRLCPVNIKELVVFLLIFLNILSSKDKKAKREEEEEREEKEEVEEKKVGDGEEKEVESLPEKNLSAPLVSYESQVRQKNNSLF